jgi:hypothetical protein
MCNGNLYRIPVVISTIFRLYVWHVLGVVIVMLFPEKHFQNSGPLKICSMLANSEMRKAFCRLAIVYIGTGTTSTGYQKY